MRKKKHTVLKDVEGSVKKEYKVLKRFKDKNENQLLFAAFVILMTSMVVINTIFIINRVPNYRNATSNSLADQRRVLTSLQTVVTDAYEVKVSNVTVNGKPDPAFTLAPTDIMLILDISITNNSAGIQQLVPAAQFFVRDRQGVTYTPHPSVFVTNPLPLTNLEPGQSITGQMSFGIPKILSHPLLYVDLGWNDNAPAVIDVMK